MWSESSPAQRTGMIKALGGLPTHQLSRDKFREDLTRQQLIQAFEEKVKFPQTIKSNTDPDDLLGSQRMSILTFNILPEPVPSEEEDTFVFGFVKSRGSYRSREDAEAAITEIIRKHDSENVNLIVPTGTWAPIVRGKKSMGGAVIDRDDVTYVTNDDADTEELNKLHSQLSKKKSEENRKMVKDVQERRKKLEEEEIEAAKEDSLDNFIKRFVVENSLRDAISTHETQLEDLRNKYRNNALYIACVEDMHPEYSEYPSSEFMEGIISAANNSVDGEGSSSDTNINTEIEKLENLGDKVWLWKYNFDRKKSGIPPFIVTEGLYDTLEDVKSEFTQDQIEEGKEDLSKVLRG